MVPDTLGALHLTPARLELRAFLLHGVHGPRQETHSLHVASFMARKKDFPEQRPDSIFKATGFIYQLKTNRDFIRSKSWPLTELR